MSKMASMVSPLLPKEAQKELEAPLAHRKRSLLTAQIPSR